MKTTRLVALIGFAVVSQGVPTRADAETRHVWEKVEITRNETGQRAFQFPGLVPGYEEYFPNLDRINPEYFHSMDKKIDYLNDQGMVPFIEVARRDIGQAWKKYHSWPESYTRYIQYVWSRYQANSCLFSPIHFDTPSQSIAMKAWNAAANCVIDRYGRPPFGTLAGTNSNPSSIWPQHA